jgi:hypothetical protein
VKLATVLLGLSTLVVRSLFPENCQVSEASCGAEISGRRIARLPRCERRRLVEAYSLTAKSLAGQLEVF